jgi:hypothetical protein
VAVASQLRGVDADPQASLKCLSGKWYRPSLYEPGRATTQNYWETTYSHCK